MANRQQTYARVRIFGGFGTKVFTESAVKHWPEGLQKEQGVEMTTFFERMHAEQKREEDAHKEERPVKIDVERLTAALSGPSVTVPAGLSREEKRRFILAHAK